MESNVQDERREAHELLDKLSAERLSVVKSLLEQLAGPDRPALGSLPEESDELTPAMTEALARARASLSQGKGIAHKDVLREFGFER